MYSPNSDTLLAAADVFAEKYGIDVQVYSMETGEIADKVVAESVNPQADVWYGGINFINGNKYQQYFEPYIANGDDKLPEAYRNQNGCVTRYCCDGSASLLINLEVFRQLELDYNAFGGYSDLLNPKLKGRIAMGNVSASSSAWAELTNMLLVMGDKPYDGKAWDFVAKLCKQLDGGLISSSSAVCKGVLNGEYAVGISYEEPCVSILNSGVKNVRLIYPEEGVVWLPAGAAIIKGAENMDNAKLFMDWLISDEGQSEISKSARPVNPYIKNYSANMKPMTEINVAYEDMVFCAKNEESWLAKFAELAKYSL